MINCDKDADAVPYGLNYRWQHSVKETESILAELLLFPQLFIAVETHYLTSGCLHLIELNLPLP